MNKKLLLFMIPILMVSTNVFATDVKKEDTIIKSIVINKTDENNFLNLLDDTIEIDSIKYNLQNKERLELETTNSKTEEQTKTLELSTNKKDKILDSFEESINKILKFGGDTDTNACITGSIAESLYGINPELVEQAKKYIPSEFIKIIEKEYQKEIDMER